MLCSSTAQRSENLCCWAEGPVQNRSPPSRYVRLRAQWLDVRCVLARTIIWTLSFVYWILSSSDASLFPSSNLFWGTPGSNLRARVNHVSLRRFQELGPHRFNPEPMHLLSRILGIRWWLRAFIAYPGIDTRSVISGL
jgi:hypothetical protein